MAVRPNDHVVLAAAGRTAFFAGLAWPGQQVLVGRGPDGADLAILAFIDVPHAVTTYGRVVIASGDHIFAPLVRALEEAGAVVEIVAPTRGISTALRRTQAPLRHLEPARPVAELPLAG
jgi:hypothetical protein